MNYAKSLNWCNTYTVSLKILKSIRNSIFLSRLRDSPDTIVRSDETKQSDEVKSQLDSLKSKMDVSWNYLSKFQQVSLCCLPDWDAIRSYRRTAVLTRFVTSLLLVLWRFVTSLLLVLRRFVTSVLLVLRRFVTSLLLVYLSRNDK